MELRRCESHLETCRWLATMCHYHYGQALSLGPEREQATASIDVRPSAVDPAASAPATGSTGQKHGDAG